MTTIAHNTSSSSIYISWKPPPPDTILGEFLGYRITYRVRDRHNDTTEEIYIRDSSVEVSVLIIYNVEKLRHEKKEPKRDSPQTNHERNKPKENGLCLESNENRHNCFAHCFLTSQASSIWGMYDLCAVRACPKCQI